MILSLRASSSRLPVLNRAKAFSTTLQPLDKASLKASPSTPRPTDLLAKIGRNADKRLTAQAESWESLSELWQNGSEGMKAAGLGVKDRRYILWAFSKYSQGLDPVTFLRPPTPPKKFRGWGPKIQHGVRVRG